MRVLESPGLRRLGRLADRAVTWIEPRENPRSVVYGSITVGLLLAAEDPAEVTYPDVVAATVIAVGLYWLAHAYADALGDRFTQPAAPSWARFTAALHHELALVKGTTAPLLALLGAWAAGAAVSTGVTAAVWTAVVSLFAYETVAGIRARLPWPQRLGSAVVGAALGAALLAVKALLH